MGYTILLVGAMIVGYFYLPAYFAYQAIIFAIILVIGGGVYVIYKFLCFYEKCLILKKRICARFHF
jgi:hypothetical protein